MSSFSGEQYTDLQLRSKESRILTAVAPVRFVPIRDTGTTVPCAPAVGLIEDNVGPCTVNAPVNRLVVPMGVVTLTKTGMNWVKVIWNECFVFSRSRK